MATGHAYRGSGPDPLEGRVVRFQDLEGQGTPLMFIDSVLSGGLRMNYSMVGDVAMIKPQNYEEIVRDLTAKPPFQPRKA